MKVVRRLRTARGENERRNPANVAGIARGRVTGCTSPSRGYAVILPQTVKLRSIVV